MPPSESAGSAGVGTLVSSTRERLLIETWSNWNTRVDPPVCALATCMPSAVTCVRLLGSPRTDTEMMFGSAKSAVMEGRYLMNSPTLPCETSPKASAATTFLMFAAKRCSFTARAATLVSRAAVIVKGSSWATAIPEPIGERSTRSARVSPAPRSTVISRGSCPV